MRALTYSSLVRERCYSRRDDITLQEPLLMPVFSGQRGYRRKAQDLRWQGQEHT